MKHTRPKPPRRKASKTDRTRRPKGKPRNAEPLTDKNRSARDGWGAGHFFESVWYGPVEDPGAWYSIPEVVALLGVSIKTVKKMVSTKKLASKRHGYYRLVSKLDVDKFMRA
jgi:excisionase family DNA binding protein